MQGTKMNCTGIVYSEKSRKIIIIVLLLAKHIYTIKLHLANKNVDKIYIQKQYIPILKLETNLFFILFNNTKI